MARGRADRRGPNGHTEGEELLDNKSSLSTTPGVVERSLKRKYQERGHKTIRVAESQQGNDDVFSVSERLRSWTQFGSWAVCVNCGSGHRNRLPMEKFHIDTPWGNTFVECSLCDNKFLRSAI